MKLHIPFWYREFKCIASACNDTCCAGWEIGIDRDTQVLYELLPGSLGEDLRSYMEPDEDPENADAFAMPTCHFRLLEKDRCPFLTEDNLCRLICQQGEKLLCQICRDHPRFHEWFGDLKETGLGLCCEEAARLALLQKEPFRIIEEPLEEETNEEFAPEEQELLEALLSARQKAFALLQGERFSLKQGIFLLLCFGEDLQDCFDLLSENLPALSQNIRELTRRYEDELFLLSLLQEPPLEVPSAQDTVAFLSFLQELEPMDELWPLRLKALQERAEDLVLSLQNTKKFSPARRQYENFLCNFLYRYWMKSFFDGELLPRLQMALHCLWLLLLLEAGEKESEGKISGEERAMLAKAISKELEYSEENLEKLLDLTRKRPELSV